MVENRKSILDSRMTRRSFLTQAVLAPTIVREVFAADTADAAPLPQNPCLTNPNLCNSNNEDSEMSASQAIGIVCAAVGAGVSGYVALDKMYSGENNIVYVGKVIGAAAVGAGVAGMAGYSVAEAVINK